MKKHPQDVYIIRHGETEWSVNGKHTGSTDIPLTENGRRMARRLQSYLENHPFELVLTSPLQRARETCMLAGLGEQAVVEPDLVEWNYGVYEGLTPGEILAQAPGWMIFAGGCPSGETPDRIGERVDRVISKIQRLTGNVAVFAHGHLLRVFAARWLNLPASAGRHFLLETGTVSILSFYRNEPAIRRWNVEILGPRSTLINARAIFAL